ncbi:MAG: hypothetical protein ND866_07995 [Pyrinomonadaceae bacterium]|nr:hypothetical protein [Pyrinomonadaceae bacterium]
MPTERNSQQIYARLLGAFLLVLGILTAYVLDLTPLQVVSARAQNEPTVGFFSAFFFDFGQFNLPRPCSDRTQADRYCYLSRKGIGNDITADNYYKNTGARRLNAVGGPVDDTLEDFQQRNGFPDNEVHAIYFNGGDLQLGRDMHCREGSEVSPGSPRIACYVSNYGPPPYLVNVDKPNPDYPNPTRALDEATRQIVHPFATVAMEYSPTPPTVTIPVVEGFGITSNPNPPRGCPFVGYIISPGGLPNRDVDTGIDVEPGDDISFSASGTIWTGYCFYGDNDANGLFPSNAVAAADYPLPTAASDSLIGRIGNLGPYFFIGAGGSINNSGRGRLFLRTNDNNPGNGSGAFQVSITVRRENVRFYVYGVKNNLTGKSSLELNAALDGEGLKAVPQMCLTCHGGFFIPATNKVLNASFLPFDVFSFRYSSNSPFRRGDQEESFTKLNDLVVKTRPNAANPNNPVQKLIGEWYKAGRVAQNSVPAEWKDHSDLYLEVVRPVCRTCHVAQSSFVDFSTYQNFFDRRAEIADKVCTKGRMPQAQIPYEILKATPVSPSVKEELRDLGISCILEYGVFRLQPSP